MKLIAILMYCVGLQVQFLAHVADNVAKGLPAPELSQYSLNFAEEGVRISGPDCFIIACALEVMLVCILYLLSRIPRRQPKHSLDSQF